MSTRRAMPSSLKIPDEWFEPDFCHQAALSYAISTASCNFSFSCHRIVSTTYEHTILYGELWEVDNSRNNGWRLIYIGKNEKIGSMYVVTKPISALDFNDKTFKALLVSHLALGMLPPDVT